MGPIATLNCVQNVFNIEINNFVRAILIVSLLYIIDLALTAEGKVN